MVFGRQVRKRPFAPLRFGQHQPLLPIRQHPAQVEDDIDRVFGNGGLGVPYVQQNAVPVGRPRHLAEHVGNRRAAQRKAHLVQHHDVRRQVGVAPYRLRRIRYGVGPRGIAVSGGIVHQERHRVINHGAVPAKQQAGFQPLGRAVGVNHRQPPQQVRCGRDRRRVGHHQEIHIADLPAETAKPQRSVHIHAGQVCPQRCLAGVLDLLKQGAHAILRHG